MNHDTLTIIILVLQIITLLCVLVPFVRRV